MFRLRLAAFLGAALAGAAVFPVQAEVLTQLKWLAPGADAAKQVTRAPAECLLPGADKEEAYKIEVGRVAFRTPELFGGQAARVGLSCNACHINGRNNLTFHIDGVTGLPGTVDVTTAVFSKVRGDGIFNPRPIPSLVGTAFEAAYGHDAKVTSLSEFVHGVAVEEFQGDEPDPKLFDALIAYVRSLDPAACPPDQEQAITLKSTISDIDRGAAALDETLDRGDKGVGRMLVLGLRSMLGRLNERYANAGLAKASARIVAQSRSLEALWNGGRGDLKSRHRPLADWRKGLDHLSAELAPLESKSLFNPAVVTRIVGEAGAN